MGRGLAAVALLAALTIPAGAQAKQPSMLPWPNDALTKRDRTTDTGRRLDLPRSLMPRNKDGVPIDPTDMNRADGFSPGSMIIARIPGLDNAEALRRSHLPLAAQPRREPRQELPGRGLQRAHRQAPSRLGRARLQRDHRRQPRPDHPPGEELQRGRALRRGAAQPRGPQRQANHAQGPWLRSVAAQGARQAARPLPGLVVHRRERAQPRGPHAAYPRRRLQGPRRHQPARPEGRRQGAHVHDRQRHGPDAGGGRSHRAARGRHDDRAVLPDATPARPAVGSRSTRRACPSTTARPRRHSRCRIPRSALDPADPPQARPSLYGHGLLGSRRRGQRRATCARWPTSTTSCSAPPRGPGSPRRTTSATSSAAINDFSRLQHGRRPHAAGLPQPAAARPADDPPAGPGREPRLPEERPQRDRHAPALLRRQQPGRRSWAAA